MIDLLSLHSALVPCAFDEDYLRHCKREKLIVYFCIEYIVWINYLPLTDSILKYSRESIQKFVGIGHIRGTGMRENSNRLNRLLYKNSTHLCIYIIEIILNFPKYVYSEKKLVLLPYFQIK